MSNNELKMVYENVNGWNFYALEFTNDKNILKKLVPGKLSNSQTDGGKKIRFECQTKIANEIRTIRGPIPRNEKNKFAISLGMKFTQDHPNQDQQFDVDNFIKPIFQGIAAGLFSDGELPPDIEDFRKYDDSCFTHLYVERLDDRAESGGVAKLFCKSDSDIALGPGIFPIFGSYKGNFLASSIVLSSLIKL